MSAVPEELRCKRSDGKQWRCSAASMPDKTVCEKHYVQAKKRSTSSALRASLRRSSCSATAVAAAGFPFPAASYVDADPPMAVARPIYGRVAGEAVYVAEPVPAQRAVYDGLPIGVAAGARSAAVSIVSLQIIEAALPSLVSGSWLNIVLSCSC
jgi:[histone H3]-dimethyl-L-lysine9 demethylase